MTPAWLLRRAALLATWATVACSPALNWREVRLDRLTAMLPCKPDQAQRPVRLGAIDVSLEMSGCEASDALFAVSHVRAAEPQHVTAVLAEWRKAALANMQATRTQPQTFKLTKAAIGVFQLPDAASGPLPGGALEMVLADGTRADGSPVQARLVWFAQGVDVYHVAFYGARLDQEAFDLFFSGLSLQ